MPATKKRSATGGRLLTDNQTMPFEGEHSARGGKLSRSEVVTIRLDPKMRYLAELAGANSDELFRVLSNGLSNEV